METNSLVTAKTVDEIQAEQTAEAEAVDKAQSASQEASIGNLANHIRKGWERALDYNRPFHKSMLASKRARMGEYEPDKLAAIKALHGQDYEPIYMMITETKCRDAESWIKDILMQPGETPWDLEPTPIPELPEETNQEINQQAMSHIQEQAQVMAQQTGYVPSPEEVQGVMPYEGTETVHQLVVGRELTGINAF